MARVPPRAVASPGLELAAPAIGFGGLPPALHRARLLGGAGRLRASAYGIIFLSFTLVTGEGGMIWLCQATFAGVGGFTMAILAVDHGWPVYVAVFMGGLVACPSG